MSPDTTDEEGFTALHSRCRLADDGTPVLLERVVRYLDGDPGATRLGTPPVPLTLDDALGRPVCRCQAYRWPHRPGSGLCRWPEEPRAVCATPLGTRGRSV